jgi:hypothetical protein
MLTGLPLFACPSAAMESGCSLGAAFFGFSLGTLLFFAFLLYVAVKLIRRRKKGKGTRKEQGEMDRWVHETLARELNRKLGVERDLVQRALEGTPEPDAVGAIEEAVRSVQVKYGKTPDGSVEARLEISFEDGSSATSSRIVPSDQVPRGIMDEFARTGGAYVFRPVHFPWSGPDRGWS